LVIKAAPSTSIYPKVSYIIFKLYYNYVWSVTYESGLVYDRLFVNISCVCDWKLKLIFHIRLRKTKLLNVHSMIR
jgi:hypothetical protein